MSLWVCLFVCINAILPAPLPLIIIRSGQPIPPTLLISLMNSCQFRHKHDSGDKLGHTTYAKSIVCVHVYSNRIENIYSHFLSISLSLHNSFSPSPLTPLVPSAKHFINHQQNIKWKLKKSCELIINNKLVYQLTTKLISFNRVNQSKRFCCFIIFFLFSNWKIYNI